VGVLKVMLSSKRWEDRFGGITGATLFLNELEDPDFSAYLMEQFSILFVDPEFRVRDQLAPLMKRVIQLECANGSSENF